MLLAKIRETAHPPPSGVSLDEGHYSPPEPAMKLTSIVAVVASVLVTSCQEPPSRYVLDERALLYARMDPPPWEDTTNANPVVAVLSRGEVALCVDEEYRKDYAIYEIRLDDGKVAYMFSGTRFHLEQPPTPASTGTDPDVPPAR